MSFASDMQKIIDKTSMKLESLGKAVKVETFNGVIRDTRVDTGRARGNWQTSEEIPITSTIDRLDPAGGAAMSDVRTTSQGISLTYLTNNLPYIEVLEEKDAMAAKNVQRVVNNVARKARELNK